MTQRALLHKTKLADFLQWLDANGIVHRAPPSTAQWQVRQIRVNSLPNGWQAIYSRIHMPEHYSVPEPLVRTVLRFIKETKKASSGTSERAKVSSPGAAPGRPVRIPGLPE